MWPTLLPFLGDMLDKLLPDPQAAADAKLKALEMAQKGELAHLDADARAALGQMDVNAKEAQSSSLFVAGWRPGAGWVCVVSLGYSFLLQPLLAWLSAAKGWPTPPSLDIDYLMGLLGGMLGLGSLRTVEKIRGKAS